MHGDDESIRYAVHASSLGSVLVAASGRGVRAILLGDDPAALLADARGRFPRAALVEGVGPFDRTAAEVVACVEEPGRALALPLDPGGTAFQRQVWAALRDIPPGATATYTQVAAAIGRPGSVRAVAGACGANPLAVAIPCHRVLRSDGGLSGYRWGVARKAELLRRERAGSRAQSA